MQLGDLHAHVQRLPGLALPAGQGPEREIALPAQRLDVAVVSVSFQFRRWFRSLRVGQVDHAQRVEGVIGADQGEVVHPPDGRRRRGAEESACPADDAWVSATDVEDVETGGARVSLEGAAQLAARALRPGFLIDDDS